MVWWDTLVLPGVAQKLVYTVETLIAPLLVEVGVDVQLKRVGTSRGLEVSKGLPRHLFYLDGCKSTYRRS